MTGDSTRPTILWDTVLTAAKLHCDENTFNTMLLYARLDGYNAGDESVVIQIPAATSAIQFRQNAVPVLERAFANALGIVPRIFVETRDDLPGGQTPTATPSLAVAQTPHGVEPDDTVRAARPPSNRLALNPDYVFSSFVVGPSNRMAEAAARAVSDQPGRAYNPLFLHGSVGLGKTHLLQAICHKVLGSSPGARIRYLSCEQFVNDFVDATKNGRCDMFRRAFRGIDLLVVDDIHFLANKEQSQEEFFHTFNDLYNSGKQIIISSDSSPKEIPKLEERLVSRFLWGLPVRIESPCTETREAIILKKAEQRGVELPRDVVEFLAQTITSNIRELEGAVIQVAAMANMLRRPISLAVAREALKDLISLGSVRRVSIDNIVEITCRHFGVRLADLQSSRRHRSVTGPRQVAMYLAKKMTQKTLGEIGGFFGGRDHTTVLHSIRKIEEEINASADFARQLTLIETELEKTKT